MTQYQDAIQMLLARPECQSWDDLRRALNGARNHQPVAWHFPLKASEAVGGDAKGATPAVSAITCAHMAIILLDDILDEDPRGAYRHMGTGRAANLAVGLNALGVQVLLEAEECVEHEKAAAALIEMIRQTAYGQNLDVINLQTEEGYWKVTRAKSSPYFGAALYIGALFGGAAVNIAMRLKKFGELYGEIMQIHDDLNDSLAVPANVDWLSGRSPLPLLFAHLVDHPDRQRFIDLRSQVADLEALKEAQTILVRCGAISYCVNELLNRHSLATKLINEMDLKNPDSMKDILEESIAPVRHLFSKVGADFQAVV